MYITFKEGVTPPGFQDTIGTKFYFIAISDFNIHKSPGILWVIPLMLIKAIFGYAECSDSGNTQFRGFDWLANVNVRAAYS